MHWYLVARPPLWSLMTPEGGCAMLRDETGRCLMLVYTSIGGVRELARFLGVDGRPRALPLAAGALAAQAREVGAVGIAIDYDPETAERPVTEQWVPETVV